MTTRYEGAGAKDTRITVHAAGEEIGADVVPEGQIALAFSYDEVFYLQGKPHEVRQLLFGGIQQVNGNAGFGLHVVKLYANLDREFDMYGDIYDTPADVRKEHPDAEILHGFGVLDGATGFLADGSEDWYEVEDDALAFISAARDNEEYERLRRTDSNDLTGDEP